MIERSKRQPGPRAIVAWPVLGLVSAGSFLAGRIQRRATPETGVDLPVPDPAEHPGERTGTGTGSSTDTDRDDYRARHHGPSEDPDAQEVEEVEERVESPTDLERRSVLFTVRQTMAQFSKDQCTDLAATLTYYAVLALFPAVIALTSLLGLVGQGTSAVDEVLDIVTTLGGTGIVDTIGPTLRDLSSSHGAGAAFVTGLLGALWSASGYVGAFGRAMNRMYEIEEGRPVWKLRPLMLALTAVLVVMVAVVLLGLIVTGPVAQAVGDQIGVGGAAVTTWNIVKWPVMLAVVVLIVALLYYATPNVQQPRFRWISVGAGFAIVVWVLVSVAFGFYVANFSSYNKTYGTLGGVIAFLLWLWLTNLALLFGAELDSELERARELQAGLPAADELQLPVRDDRQIRKRAQKEQKARTEADELRTQEPAR